MELSQTEKDQLPFSKVCNEIAEQVEKETNLHSIEDLSHRLLRLPMTVIEPGDAFRETIRIGFQLAKISEPVKLSEPLPTFNYDNKITFQEACSSTYHFNEEKKISVGDALRTFGNAAAIYKSGMLKPTQAGTMFIIALICLEKDYYYQILLRKGGDMNVIN
jgi:hypothetical protein